MNVTPIAGRGGEGDADEMGAAVFEGKLYAVGGYDGSYFLDTVEAYEPEANTWTAVASLATKRCE